MEIIRRDLDKRDFIRDHLIDLLRNIDHNTDWYEHHQHHDERREVAFEDVFVDYCEFHILSKVESRRSKAGAGGLLTFDS